MAKKMFGVVCAAALALSLGACGGGQPGGAATPSGGTQGQEQQGQNQLEDGQLSDDAIKIDELTFDVSQGVDGGSRRAMFSYTNNSNFTIISVELSLTFQDDIEPEELEEPFAYIIENGSTTDDILEGTMRCESTLAVDPGETSGDRTMNFGGYYVLTVDQYELMSPDMLTIQFLHDGLIYEEYYDYLSDSYSLSSETIDPNQWGEREPSTVIPHPENGLVVEVEDTDSRFHFEAVAMTPEEFSAYVNACRDAGFTSDVTESDSIYYASNVDGTYRLDLMYSDHDGTLTAYVDPIQAE